MNKAYIKPDREVIEKLYIDEKKSMADISKVLGISTGSVFNCMKEYGIKSRPQNVGMKGKHHTEEVRHIISKTHKGKVLSDETRHRISESHKIKGIGHKKERTDGYVSLYYPEHPYSNQDGYIMEHRYIMEQHIGRYIKDDEVVHHKNKNRSDNRLENLELMTFKEHAKLHMEERHRQRREMMTYQYCNS